MTKWYFIVLYIVEKWYSKHLLFHKLSEILRELFVTRNHIVIVTEMMKTANNIKLETHTFSKHPKLSKSVE